MVQSYAPGLSSAAAGGPVPGPSAPTADQLRRAIDGVAGPAGTRQVGGYGTLVPPPDLAGYGNGRVPAEALSPVGQGSHRLWEPAAASWSNVVAAARADGARARVAA